ncbi:uncharacterized protein LOC134210423 [Armigeres subalbatus]|uniref:uncharacterized protein LOC134210423 n=1 Tax=Armigeres subalbatus TaxID=124917 RepID=UPI002ED39ECE
MAESVTTKTLGAYVHSIRFKFATKQVFQKLNVLLYGVEGHLNRYRANVINFRGFQTKEELEEFRLRLQQLPQEDVVIIAELLNGDATTVTKKDLYDLVANLGSTINDEPIKKMERNRVRSTFSSAVEEAEKELELTKKMQELERAKMEVEHNLKLKEIENKILQARLDDQDLQSEASSLYSVKSTLKNEFKTVKDWVDKSVSYAKEEIPSFPKIPDEVVSHERPLHPPVNNPASNRLEKLLTRQLLGFDLPRFSDLPRLSTEDGEFSDAENMMRLRKCLDGPAKESVEMLLLTNDILRTLDVLKRNYGDSKVILRKVLDKVSNFKFVHDSRGFLEFSNLVENVAVIIGSFQAKNHDVEAVLGKLLQKLRDYLRMQWGSFQQDYHAPVHNLDGFSAWVRRQVAVVENAHIGQQVSAQENIRPTPVQNNMRTCLVCKTGEHQIEKCPIFVKMDLNRRWDAARKYSLCFLCLTKHNAKCTNTAVCGLSDCTRRHHKLLHRMESSNPLGVVVEDRTRSAILKYVPVQVRGPNGVLSTTAFIDDGSSLTLIEADVAAGIGVTGRKSPVSFTWTGNIRREEENSEIVQLKISADIPVGADRLLQKYPYLSSIDRRTITGSQPTILIGQNNWRLIVPREHYAPDGNSPIISKTRLGWVVHGPVVGLGFKLYGTEEEAVNVCVEEQLAELTELVRSNMALDNFGVCVDNVNNQKSVDDNRAIDIAKNSIKKVGERSSLGTALRNLECVEKRLQRQNLTKQYNEIIRSYQEKGYVTQIPWQQVDWNNRKLWFLPHFPVLNVHKPGKIRMVFNSAAKSNGKCLNDYLLSGPPSGIMIFGILGRFRKYPVAVGADVSEMFHKVFVREQDSWSQCFLHRNDPSERPQV